jgi:3-hydroxyacyl-CoA dehydrogenase
LAAKLAYFEPERDSQVMNRDRLVEAALKQLVVMGKSYKPRQKPVFQLAGGDSYDKMVAMLEKGREKGWFFPHDVTVASQIGWIVTGGEGAKPASASETDMYAREREAFICLAKTPETKARIKGMLSGAGVPRN